MVGKVVLVTTLTLFIFLPYLVAFTLNEDADANFYFVGTVDDKSFFADNGAAMTWYEAKAHCTAVGMHLATVKTSAQNNLLQASYSAYDFVGTYWTAGIDALTIQQFVWDGTTEALNETILSDNLPSQDHSCLYFYLRSSSYSIYSWRPCANRHLALCEIIHGSN